jgi:hypothetical protein
MDGRCVEYNTGRTDRRGNVVWDVGRVRAVAHDAGACWVVLVEEHDGALVSVLHDELRLVDDDRARQLERNRAARDRSRRRAR